MNRIIVADPAAPWLGGNIKGGDDMTFAPEIWDYLIQQFKPKSICDVGCGEGYLMKYFADKGIDVFGIDGMAENKQNAPLEVKDKIFVHDYTCGVGPVYDVDMVISCEFVEHIEAQYILNYILQFINCDILVLTHALPDQPGYHHVNCQTSEYWINLMKAFHFRPLIIPIRQARQLAENKVLWQTILIFKKLASNE